MAGRTVVEMHIAKEEDEGQEYLASNKWIISRGFKSLLQKKEIHIMKIYFTNTSLPE